MKRIAFLVLGIALLVALSAAAQGATLGLSADDFALLSAANGAALDSFAFDYTAHVAVEGLDTFAARADLSGAGAVDRLAPALDMSFEGTLGLGTSQLIPIDTDLRWLNDTLYLNPGDGWQAREGASAYAADVMAQYGGLSADSNELSHWSLSSIDGWDDIIQALASADPGTFLAAQRLNDEPDGSAHFQISADLHAVMQTDAFAGAVAAFASAQGNNLVIVDHDELGEIVRANSALFEGVTLTIDEYVSPDDSTLRRVILSLEMPLDPARLDYDDAPFTLSASLDLTLSDVNQPPSISTPDDAETVSEFAFPAPPPPETPGVGGLQYVYFETVGEGETYTRSFDAQAGDVVTITVRGLGLELDSLLQLLAPGGDVLLENDDHEALAFGVGDYDSQIVDYAIAESGTYSVVVTELDGAAGSFVLTVTVER